MKTRTGGVDFEYGMALAHLLRWQEARAALLDGRRLCWGDKRFPIELGGVAFEQKKYAEAAMWLRRGLKIDPRDAYALNFAGAVYELMGNLPAALKYWNRAGKPYVAALRLDPGLGVEHRVLDRAFAFGPAAILEKGQLDATEARLRALGIFPVYSIGLHARADGTFDADFNAVERDGFGSNRWQVLIATLGGLPYETIYPGYFDVEHGGANLESLLRWDAEKERVWIEAAAPLHGLPQWRWRMATDERAENWELRRSFTGPAPSLGSLRLSRAVVSTSLTSLESGRTQWTVGGEISDRRFSHVVEGPALNSSLLADGLQLKLAGSIDRTLMDVPEHRFKVRGGAGTELARLWATPARIYGKVQGDARLQWFPQATGDAYEFEQRVRAGTTMGKAPFDELWMLGVERDNDLWLRGLLDDRDGRKGSSPLGDRYFLSNSDFDRRIYSNGLITIAAGPLFDAGRAAAPTSGLAPDQWLLSAGAEVKVTVLGVSAMFTYGRELRMGTNAFFGTLAR